MEAYDPESYWSGVAREIKQRKRAPFLAGDANPYLALKRRKFIDAFLSAIDVDAKVVLEVGCGPGGNLAFLSAHRTPRKLLGVDISEAMIGLCRQNLARRAVTAELYKIDGTRLPFPDRSIDVTFTATVLQHNTDEAMFRALVRDMCRVTNTTIVAMEDTGGGGFGGTGDHVDRRVDVYRAAFADGAFALSDCRYLGMRASRRMDRRLRRVFLTKDHHEGRPEPAMLRALLTLFLPVTRLLDGALPDSAGLTKMVFHRTA